jgi:hypothetical protein
MACCPRRSGRSRASAIAIRAASDDRTPILTGINIFFLFAMMAVVMMVTMVVVTIMLVIVVMVMVMVMLVIVVIFVVVVTDMAIVLDMHLILIQVFPVLAILVVYRQTGRRWVWRERYRLGCFLG